jgi:hypothetical protein
MNHAIVTTNEYREIAILRGHECERRITLLRAIRCGCAVSVAAQRLDRRCFHFPWRSGIFHEDVVGRTRLWRRDHGAKTEQRKVVTHDDRSVDSRQARDEA